MQTKKQVEEQRIKERLDAFHKKQTFSVLETTPKKYRFISFDVETTTRNNNFYLCGVIDENGHYKTYWSEQEVIDYFDSLKDNDLMIVATNLDFDFSNIFKTNLAMNKCEFVVNNGRFIMITMSTKYGKIKLYDTLNYGGFSVETMGKILGKPKLKHPICLGKTPKNKREKQELITYNIRDCEVTRDFMIMLQDAINLEGGELKATVSSCALDVYRRRFMPFSMTREEVETGLTGIKHKIHKAFYGGRTEAFMRGKIRDYNYYDVNCFSDDTELLTDKGFVNIKDLDYNYNCFGFDIFRNVLVKQKINSIITDIVIEKEMYNLESENVSQLITPNHRVYYKTYNRSKFNMSNYKSWSCWKIKEVKDIPKSYIKVPNTRIYDGLDNKIDKNLLKLSAWYITEGHISKNGMIEISQSLSVNKVKCDILLQLLEDCKIKYRKVERVQKGKKYLYVYFRKEIIKDYFTNIEKLNSYNMRLVNNFIELSYNDKLLFFYELMLGDGSYSKGKTSYVSYSDKLLDDIQILVSMIGFKASINYKNHILNIKLNRNNDSSNIKFKKVNYNGVIWCVSTDYKNVVVRRNGKVFISGNSLYPTMMLKDFPVPQSINYFSGEDRKLLQFKGVSFFKLDIPYSKYPLLPYRYNERLVFPYGRFMGYYTHEEINRAIELYGKQIIVEMRDSVFYKGVFPVFKKFVEYMYKRRLEEKAKKSPFEVFYKLMMNSLFGKFAMKNIANTSFFIPETEEDVVNQILKAGEKANISVHLNKVSYYTNNKEYDGVFSFPILSCYVTAYARIHLHKYIEESCPCYVDTDSLFTTKSISTSNVLGDMKLEEDIKTGIVIKPKSYFLNDKIKFKGLRIPKDYKHINRLKENILKGNPIHYEKFVKIKEGIKRQMNINSITVVAKSVDLEDKKRDWGGKKFNPDELQDSNPLFMEEW